MCVCAQEREEEKDTDFFKKSKNFLEQNTHKAMPKTWEGEWLHTNLIL